METKIKLQISTALSVLFCIALCLCILIFSIGLPIYCRPFYYTHIDSLDMAESSGFSKSEIKDSYNELLDFLTLPDREFSTGVMACSAEAESHFVDCKLLFDLNLAVFSVSLLILITLIVLQKSGKVKGFNLGKRHASFYSGLLALVIPVVVGALAAIDFDRAFSVFHKVFFPGKDNWIFDPVTDEIIKVMPVEFFMNCAILIGVSIVCLSVILIVAEVIRCNIGKTRNKYSVELNKSI